MKNIITFTSREDDRIRRRLWILAAVALLIFTAQGAALAVTFTVNRLGDDADTDLYDGVCDSNPIVALNQCTLRAAIEQANATPGIDEIHFNITFGVPPYIIQPLSELPAITDPVEIDGYTQPGASVATATVPATLRIVVDGSAVLTGSGLRLETDDNRLRGLVLHSFSGAALIISGHRNKVFGNYVGTDASGSIALPNEVGINVTGSDNQIGGRNEAKRNIISGNTDIGLYLGGEDNLVLGNLFGTDPAMTIDLGNGGFAPAGALNGAIVVTGPNNDVGGRGEGAMNVIAGNSIGVYLGGDSGGSRVRGNHIGTDLAGTGSRIGLANINGIQINSNNNQIGSPHADGRNVIANSISAGIEVWGDDNRVVGNYVGLDSTGATALPNGGMGIQVFGQRNRIGDPTPGGGNVVSGNDSSGIGLTYSLNAITLQTTTPVANKVMANIVGLDATGTYPIGNGFDGVQVFNGTLNQIGGDGDDEGNTISGNGRHGVKIEKFGTHIAGGNLVKGNTIGLNLAGDPAGNLDSGVTISGANTNWIGGTLPGAGNTIAHNGGDGVTVSSGEMNAILGNAIFDNTFLGIDLADDGVSLNDNLDADTGANQLQNFPVLLSALNAGGETEISGELHSTPATEFRVEWFSSPACDPSGNGEGQTFLGASTIVTDASGDASAVFTIVPEVTAGRAVTATATPMGSLISGFSTSEFSACVNVQ